MPVKAVVIEIRSPRECTVFESWLQKSTPSILLVPLAASCGSDVRRKAGQPGKWNERRWRNRTAFLDEDDRTGHIEKVLKRTAYTRGECLLVLDAQLAKLSFGSSNRRHLGIRSEWS
jgi:hypothetical protein